MAIAVSCLLLVGSVLLLRPETYAAERRNSQRWVGISELVDALDRYQAVHGHMPARITAKPQVISSLHGALDLCRDLVPEIVDNLPFDPSVGAEAVTDPNIQVENCATPSVMYSTGYSVSLSKTGQLTVSANSAEHGEKISITRHF